MNKPMGSNGVYISNFILIFKYQQAVEVSDSWIPYATGFGRDV